MSNLPSYISFFFMLTVLATVVIFYKATRRSTMTWMVLSAWLTIQAVVSLTGFYAVTSKMPPRFILTVVPPALVLLALFINRKGKKYIDSLDIRMLTILHTIRLPIEVVLFWLFLQKAVPRIMTFEGRNFDIISGLTAPLIYYFGYCSIKIGPRAILLWNFLCLGLLINIVIV